MRRYVASLVVLVVGIGHLRAGDDLNLHDIVGKPLQELPPHVSADQGRLTLYADFDRATDKGVPIYVVNRTGKPVRFFAQDGDIFAKLEYEAAPGKWVRAQPHAFSTCGNSYFFQPTLLSDSYMIVTGYAPQGGVKARVRYRFYHQQVEAASNLGDGFINDLDVENAANDGLAVESWDWELTSKVALGQVVRRNAMDGNDLRAAALWRLANGGFDWQKVEVVLQAIVESADEKYARRAERELLSLRKKWRCSE